MLFIHSCIHCGSSCVNSPLTRHAFTPDALVLLSSVVSFSLSSSSSSSSLHRQASRPASVLYFACRIFNVVGTSNPTAFNELKKTQDLLHLLLSVRVTLLCLFCSGVFFRDVSSNMRCRQLRVLCVLNGNPNGFEVRLAVPIHEEGESSPLLHVSDSIDQVVCVYYLGFTPLETWLSARLFQVLASCVRCTQPPFPRGEDRLKLMVQTLQGLFLLGVRFTKEVIQILMASLFFS